MGERLRRSILAIAFGAIVAVALPETSFGFGSVPASGPRSTYIGGTAGPQEGDILARIRLDPVLFALNTVGDSHRVVPVEVRNESPEPLFLSRSADQITATVKGEEIQGSFVLSEANPEFWDALDQAVREWITYPDEIRTGDTGTLYAFFEASEMDEMPESFVLHIDALDDDLRLISEPPAMAK